MGRGGAWLEQVGCQQMRQMLGHTGKHRHSAPGRLPPLQTSGLQFWSVCLVALGNEPLQALWQRGLALRCLLNGVVHWSTVNALISVPALSTQASERQRSPTKTHVSVHKELDQQSEMIRLSLKDVKTLIFCAVSCELPNCWQQDIWEISVAEFSSLYCRASTAQHICFSTASVGYLPTDYQHRCKCIYL